MDPAIYPLIAASTAFVGSHIAMSHPLRAPMVKVLGDKGFLGVYSLVSLAAMVWMVRAFNAAPKWQEPAWRGYDEVSWTLASLLTVVALVLLLGSFRGNPAMPDTPADRIAAAAPRGVFRVTRHPMMWGIALWGITHVAIMPTGRTLVLAGSLALLALLGSHLQDRKKEALLGDAWQHWEAQTSYWPRWRYLFTVSPLLWIAAFALWLLITWGHAWLFYVPAGIWRWVG